MSVEDRLGGLFFEGKRNAILAWTLIAILVLLVGERILLAGDIRTAVLGTVLLVLGIIPPITYRNPLITLPWDLLLIACLPVLWEIVIAVPLYTDIVPYVAVAVVALFIAVELHAFTPVRMNHTFAVLLVTLTTMAAAAVYNISLWLSDHILGTSFLLDGRHPDAINASVMIEFGYAIGAGLVAAVAFIYFFEKRVSPASERTYVPPRPSVPEQRRARSTRGKTLSNRLRIAEHTQRKLTRGMQVLLILVFLFGVIQLDLPTIANAALAVGITVLPGILERDLDLPMDSGLALWITTAVFLHAIGSAGLYDLVTPWDHLTHAVSASVVAAAGYAGFRAIHMHTDHVYIPPKFMFVLILIFVLAAGVIWEVIEFIIDQIAIMLDLPAVLAQHGIHDTIVDLIFNIIGALITAIWGTIYLTDVSESISDHFS